ncbi:alpha/beta fold hydrolase [bacterium]|nr:alpha/beta fold hydrolase [bacterium]
MEVLRNLELKGADDKPVLADVYFNLDRFNKPVVLFNHGFKGFKDWGIWDKVARNFADNGYVFIKFNQSHNGCTRLNSEAFEDMEAFGRNTYSRELRDIDCMVAWIIDNPVLPTDLMNTNEINLIGHSRGGATAILYASNNPVIKKLITWAAFKDIAERYKGPEFANWQKEGVAYIHNSRTGQQMPQYYEIYEDYLAHKEAFSIENACKKMKQPHLVVHGTEDPTVIFSDALALKNWNKEVQLYLVPNGNHVFGGSHPYRELLLPPHAALAVKETLAFLHTPLT